MAENISLQQKKQKSFDKSVTNLLHRVKSGDAATPTSTPPLSRKMRKVRGIFPDRGVVYLAHIPHGFYEEEMKAFFSQFGHVTRLRHVRSNKTGNSRGFAFIEFRFSEVAKVVAETMNNYLMRNRLLKATFIPSEKQNPKMFLHSQNYGPESCVGLRNRKLAVKAHNKPLTDNQQRSRFSKLQEKLKAQGVDFVFQVDNGTSDNVHQNVTSTSNAAKQPSAGKSAKANTSTIKKAQKRLISDQEKTKAPQPLKKTKPLKEPVKSVKKATDKGKKVVKKEKKMGEKKAVPKKVVAKKTTAVKKDVKKTIIKKTVTKKLAVKKK